MLAILAPLYAWGHHLLLPDTGQRGRGRRIKAGRGCRVIRSVSKRKGGGARARRQWCWWTNFFLAVVVAMPCSGGLLKVQGAMDKYAYLTGGYLPKSQITTSKAMIIVTGLTGLTL